MLKVKGTNVLLPLECVDMKYVKWQIYVWPVDGEKSLIFADVSRIAHARDVADALAGNQRHRVVITRQINSLRCRSAKPIWAAN